jgi:hypothetical protein
LTRADLEISPEQAGIRPFGLGRLWLRAFAQRSDRRGAGVDDRRITDTGFARLNGSAGDPLSWNLSFEDRSTHRPAPSDWRDLSRRQSLDLSAQVRPHASIDAYGRLESDRELNFLRARAPGGFTADRLALATVHLYPGRLLGRLAPLSLRADWVVRGNEAGDPGVALPGGSALWRAAADASLRQRARDGVVETRLQALSWLRLVERWEETTSSTRRPGSGRDTRDRSWETRFELQPAGGLLILRGIAGAALVPGWSETRSRRYIGQWDQTWGGGWLTNVTLDALRSDGRAGNLRSEEQLWNPQGRITWRRTRWQTDASIGWNLSWDRRRDPGAEWREDRKRSADFTLSLQPHRVVALQGQYAISGGAAETTQELRIRVRVRV